MKRFACAAALLALAAAALAAGAAPAPGAKQVKGQGCVQAGVETGCLLVKDAATGKLYYLLIKDAKPAIGIGIDFGGTLFGGTSTCMQGTPVQVSTWSHNDSVQCTRSRGKSVQ